MKTENVLATLPNDGGPCSFTRAAGRWASRHSTPPRIHKMPPRGCTRTISSGLCRKDKSDITRPNPSTCVGRTRSFLREIATALSHTPALWFCSLSSGRALFIAHPPTSRTNHFSVAHVNPTQVRHNTATRLKQAISGHPEGPRTTTKVP